MSRVSSILVAVLLLTVINTLRAADPSVLGNLQGVELAQQTDNHPAIFVGVYGGTVGGRLAVGAWAAGIHHDVPLPDVAGESIAITSGEWQLQVWVLQGWRFKRVTLSGDLTGTLVLNEPDLFGIDATMNVTSGGSGSIVLGGTLDHTVFPPLVTGLLQ